MKEDLRNVFFIIKGQYRKKSPVMTFRGNDYYVGAYDPEDEETTEWYRVLDRETGGCIHASNSLDKALHAIRREIIRNRDLRTYLKVNKNVPRKSPQEINLNRCAEEEYGYYYEDRIRVMEDEAYAFLEDNTSVKKAKRRFKKIGEVKEVKEDIETETKPKSVGKKNKMVMHKIKLAIR